MKTYWLIVLLTLFCGCQKQNEGYVIVKYDRRPTVVFKAYSNVDTDAYVIKHGNVLIEAECGHEYQPSWDQSVPITFHCLLPVGESLSLKPVPGFVGRKGLSRQTISPSSTVLPSTGAVNAFRRVSNELNG